MKYLLLFSILFFSLKCVAQSDSADFKHRQRLWINPVQAISGQYTLAYGLRFYRNNWIEIGGGYKYIPYSIVKKLPLAPDKFFELFADPEHGVGFTGPVAMVSFIHYHHRRKDFNGFCFELFYQHLSHPPDCYYDPGAEYTDHYTYSSTKDNYGGKFLLLSTMTSSHRLIGQWYAGGGLRYGNGMKTTYSIPRIYPSAHACVDDIHDPDVITSQKPYDYVAISIHAGIRFGFQ
ncbi:MAG TPA: hypothetical protein VE978_09935 [Chitinophagales bacterium]|nr:hypothetical protein [Chitinophagales bacterium]